MGTSSYNDSTKSYTNAPNISSTFLATKSTPLHTAPNMTTKINYLYKSILFELIKEDLSLIKKSN